MTKFKMAVLGSLQDIIDEDLRNGAIAITRGVHVTGLELKEDLRRDVLAAGLGQKVAKSIRVATFPKRGHSMSAAAVVRTKARKIVDAFSGGTVIRAKRGKYLAIPTDAAPKKGTPT